MDLEALRIEGLLENSWVDIHGQVKALHALAHNSQEYTVHEDCAVSGDQIQQLKALGYTLKRALPVVLNLFDKRVAPDVPDQHRGQIGQSRD